MLEAYEYQFGPTLELKDRTRFRLWAPAVDSVTLEVEGKECRMVRNANGWHSSVVECGAGARYRFRIGNQTVPDPASRLQSTDVHDPSVVVDKTAYKWRCGNWTGRPWDEVVLYELHPGLLGGFTGIRDQLARLTKLGVTALELMPIADFPGARNWGYDGVLPFAPDRSYGCPDDLKALVDAAHEHGLMVFLDVVYNHFGPDGNYLPLYAPQFFDDSKHTPWGAAIELRIPEVRRFYIENAMYWLTEFRFDGLRIDAAHAICEKTFLPELARTVRRFAGERYVHLVVENDDNDASLLRNGFDAQWNDDIHHVLHVLLTDERQGYYEDYVENPAAKLKRGLSEGFIYQGDPLLSRNGLKRGSISKDLSPTSFVSFLQNHDQIGNRAFGERLTTLADSKKLAAVIALQLLAPWIPLIFMGEEVRATEPFLYFTDYADPQLVQAIKQGREQEFARFPEFSDRAKLAQIPDPNAPETFEKSRPQLSENAQSALYGKLLELRHQYLIPNLKDIVSDSASVIGPKAVLARWRVANGGRWTIATNLGDEPAAADLPSPHPIWGDMPTRFVPAATTIVWHEAT